MLPPFISDAKDNPPDISYGSRMFTVIISDHKSKHPTFILVSYGAEYYRPFISDRKSKHPPIYFRVIRSRMLPAIHFRRERQTPDIYF